MRAIARCSLCVLSLSSLPATAAADTPSPRGVELVGGISIAGASYLGLDFSGAGPYAAVEIGLADGLDLGLDYRRHDLAEIPADGAATANARASSRLVSVLLRHSLFSLRGRRYLDLHAGLGSERFEPSGASPCTRRAVRIGVALIQPGSMYHVSDHLELRFGIDVLVARAWRTPSPVGCTGPCTSATAGRSHDFGFLGTFAIGLR